LKPPAQAILLAAGRGERMRPLTDVTPKPLLVVQGKPLMQWAMESMARGGVDHVLINTAWLEEQIPAQFGERLCVSAAEKGELEMSISYSHEGRDFGDALETAGGIVRALPQLADVFWVAAGDVFAPEFDFSRQAVDRFRASGRLAHIWLVPNPPQNPRGDFGLAADGTALSAAPEGEPSYTYSTIGLYRAEFFAMPECNIAPGNPNGVRLGLAPLLRAAMKDAKVSAELYQRSWADVGTPQRLAALNEPEGRSAPH